MSDVNGRSWRDLARRRRCGFATSSADLGQGAWTALAQVADDSLGLPLNKVEFPAGPFRHAGRRRRGRPGHTATAGGALHAAGGDVIRQRGEIAAADRHSPLHGAGNATFAAREDRLSVGGEDSFTDILPGSGVAEIAGTGFASRARLRALNAHGAIFAGGQGRA